MKKIIILFLLCLVLVPFISFARNDINSYSIEDALDLSHAKAKLDGRIKFFFGDQPFGQIEMNLGEYRTNKKTNALNKTDLEACQWVFLSAMIQLRKRAIKEGGNAVINIKSNYKNNLISSNDSFQCGAGTIIAGVALVGEVVIIKE